MSKRSSVGTPNTLFNYFSKSPASSAKIPKVKFENSPTTSSSGKATPETKSSKRKLNCEKSSDKDESDEEEIHPTITKRRRPYRMESDEECENETNNIPPENVLKKESTKKKNITKPKTLSFQEKLENIKSAPSTFKDDIDVDQKSHNLDEPTVWPHNTLEFLKPQKIKDKHGRRPDHPDYDPTTLFVPEKFLNGLTPGVRQWWDMKSNHFDCMLLFKVGKFYELYHMDADIGVKELGFTYMRGEFAHSGFPEQAYGRMSTILIEKGYKIARVEQTETPDMMTERCKKQKTVTKFDRVVKREICQISNRGTQIYNAQNQMTYNHEPNYMLSIVEKDEGVSSTYGICFIDTSIGDFFIGQFPDDKNCSRLLTLLSHNPPVLVLFEKNGTSLRTQQIFRTVLSNTLKECLVNETQFWNGSKTLKQLAENYFSSDDGVVWPKVIKLMQNEDDHLGLTPHDNFKLALKALGGCISYLSKCLLDQQVLSMARYHIYAPPDMLKDVEKHVDLTKEAKNQVEKVTPKPLMVLDSITLSNLRITDEDYSLLKTLDQCCTKFGKRLLHHWICAPSCDTIIIRERQAAISDFLTNGSVLQDARALFNSLPDFERYLAQIHSFGNKNRLKNHPDGRAILFEEKTYNKKKIQNFISILRGFESLKNIPEMFNEFDSNLIRHLTQLEPKGTFPDMSEILQFFKDAFNHEEALKEGVIAPESGIDPEFDAIEIEIEKINKQLNEYLITQEKYFGCRINYFGNDKKRFQLEVPENHARKAGDEYVLEGQRKGSKPVRRFHTAETKNFLKIMMHAEDQRNNVLKDLARRIFEKFSNYYSVWKRCADSIAILDVLASLSEYARNQNVICIPDIVENSPTPFIELEDGYHPCLPATDYIPNGIKLGRDGTAPLALLTGPNMGGKSTLMRQVGLLSIMSQIGAHIPAQSCRMSIVDRIFTRLGAQDDILAGHSTFLVELNETSSILNHATVNSLVLLDELGRGTATYDGTAIAASVVHFLADLKCRTLFSTHYHNLVDYFQNDPRISLGHMACMVESEDIDDPTQETVTFLYKYSSGACPKSYGFNAAKLAGMPHNIIKRAYELAKKVEQNALKRKIISKILNKDSSTEIKELLAKIETCKIK